MASATTPASPLTPTRGSARLARAVAAECRALERKRGQLSRRRERLIAGLEPIDHALAQIDERVALLDRLAGPLPIGHDALDAASSTVDGATLLRGPAIREAAVRTLRASPKRSRRFTTAIGTSSSAAPDTRLPGASRSLCF